MQILKIISIRNKKFSLADIYSILDNMNIFSSSENPIIIEVYRPNSIKYYCNDLDELKDSHILEQFAIYSIDATVTNDIKIFFTITQGEYDGNYIAIRGSEDSKQNDIYTNLYDIINNIEVEMKISKFVFYLISMAGLISSYIVLIIIAGRIFNINNIQGWIIAIVAITIPYMILSFLLSSIREKLFPDIEFNFGPAYKNVSKIRRKVASYIIGSIILVLVLGILANIIYSFIFKVHATGF